MASLRVLCVFVLMSLNSVQGQNPTTTPPPSVATTALPAPTPAPTSIDFRGILTCDGAIFSMKCTEGYLIQIQDAFFGRNDSVSCASNSSDMNAFCSTDDAVTTLSSYCGGKATCDIPASVAIFGGKCSQVNTLKYLRVNYSCIQTQYTALVCDAQGTIPIACPTGYLIQTSSVLYGRQDATTCNPGTPTPSNTNCSSPNATNVFRQLCDRRRVCDVTSRADLFGDACPGVGKYLSVVYSCVKCENAIGNDAQCEYWANIGECARNPGFMFPNCRKACWRCSQTAPACVNRFNNDAQCAVWAAAGQCEKNPAWMIPFCMKSCLMCPQQQTQFDCINKFTDENQCNLWANASTNECQNNPWMMSNCMRACVNCTESVPECLNRNAAVSPFKDGDCEYWARLGECEKNPVYMRKNCWQSCSGCNGAPVCVNYASDADCTLWASQDQCRNNSQWMMSYCFKTCMKCDPAVAPSCTNIPLTINGSAVNSDDQCASWALMGECRANPSYMLPSCWRACTNCSQVQACENVNTTPGQCDYWGNTGECQNNPYYMLPNCRASCTRCRPLMLANDCTNAWTNSSDCDMWAQRGDCASNPAWMLSYCRKSCTSCDVSSSQLSMIGNDALPGMTANFTKTSTVVMGDQFNAGAAVRQFTAFFAKNDTVKLQVFRPNGTNMFSLIFEVPFTPKSNSAQIVKLQPCVKVLYGDRIGFSITGNTNSPIAYNYDISAITSPLSFRKATDTATDAGPFTTISMPYRFSFSAAYDMYNSTC